MYCNKNNRLLNRLLNNSNNAEALENTEEIFIDFMQYRGDPDLFMNIVTELMQDKTVFILVDNSHKRTEVALDEFKYLMKKNKDYSDPIRANKYYYTINSKRILQDLDDAMKRRKYSEIDINNYCTIKNVIESNQYFKDNFNVPDDWFIHDSQIIITYNDAYHNGMDLLLMFMEELVQHGINNFRNNIIVNDKENHRLHSNYNEILEKYNLL